MKLRLHIILAILLSILLFNCKKKKENKTEEPTTVFDKGAMLSNYANNIIIPAYNSFKLSLDSLSSAYEVFKTSNTSQDFTKVKQLFNESYFKYQRISLFEIGPAESILIRSNFNIFPTDTPQIKANIINASYDLNLISNIDAKGFPALEFLFFGNGADESELINLFISSSNRKTYVSNLLSDMQTKLNSVISTWNSSYKNTFVNSLGTDVGSSIGYLVNQLNYELDYLKNAKIGTPLGKKTLGTPVPGSCEALYTSRSVSYAIQTLNIIEDVYLGRDMSGNNGKGFDDYLVHLDVTYNGGLLNDAIINQFTSTKNKLSLVQDPLSTQVVTSPAAADAAYQELVKLLVLLKTDMPSSLGVIITYQDGDGD